MGATKMIKFSPSAFSTNQQKKYEEWLKKNEGKVRVIDVTRTGGITNWYGPRMDLLVTYEEIGDMNSDSGKKKGH